MEAKYHTSEKPTNHRRNKKGIKICIEMNANENRTTQNLMGVSKSSAKGKVRSNTSLPQETGENQINNLTLHLKQLEKEEMKKPRVSRKKKNHKN